ncbi:MAG: protein kinase [Myxococcota bacterium]
MKICPKCGLQYPDEEQFCFVDRAPLVMGTDPFIGVTLANRYLVEDVVGRGGMATVYRARHTLVDRPVAVKIMSGQLARDPSLRERFRREAKNAAALAHPHIIEIYDYGETDDGALFLVMELLKGAPLSALIERGAIEAPQVATLGLQIAKGLARAHDFDVVHRDLKPENIFVSDAGASGAVVKLLDFGIARSMHDSRLTNQGEIFGTPQYMAPERISSIDTGPPADLYALGIILFEMLTGQLPFESEELTGFFIKHMQEPPPRPSEWAPRCPRRLEELILALLAKDPSDRPVDAHAVIRELQSLAPQTDAMAPPIVTPSRPMVAPTLPPTTAERWARRAVIFDEMLRAVYPAGAPAEVATLLEGVRDALRTMTEARTAGLQEQRTLEALEGEARESRARLGHAVQSLGEDLSAARENVRSAESEVKPYLDAEANALLAYEQAHGRLEAGGGYRRLREPTAGMAKALRDVAEAIERWELSNGAAEKARRWLEGRHEAVRDLEFQVKALRGQLARTENEYAEKRASFEARLGEAGSLVGAQEQRMLESARLLCDRLRSHPAAQPHFQRLEQETAT